MHKTKQKTSLWSQLSPLFEGLPPIFPNCYPLFDRIECNHGYWTG